MAERPDLLSGAVDALSGLLFAVVAFVILTAAAGKAGRVLRRGGRLRGKYLLTVVMWLVLFGLFMEVSLLIAPLTYGLPSFVAGSVFSIVGSVISGGVLVLACLLLPGRRRRGPAAWSGRLLFHLTRIAGLVLVHP